MAVSLLLLSALPAAALSPLSTPNFQVEITETRGHLKESFAILDGQKLVPVLATSTPVRIGGGSAPTLCTIQDSARSERSLTVHGVCAGVGTFQQDFTLSNESDVLEVATQVKLNPGVGVHSVEDRYSFLPPRHSQVNELQGPLDFVWSQNIKRQATDLIPQHAFKSPALIMQQGSALAALLPEPNERHVQPLALDLDVTSDAQPWMSYGAVPSTPHDHSYFERAHDTTLRTLDNTITYRYAMVLSAQPRRLGYRRVTRLLWERVGQPTLDRSAEAQRNPLRPDLASFSAWRKEAWTTYADKVYRSFPCEGRVCGTLMSNRNFAGDWQHPEPDAWFNAWFQTLRTAYGWYLHGRATGDREMMRKAESVLNLALTSPQKNGAFGTIYLLNAAKWIPGDGWSSYADSYHAFSMSWTAYWMLRWAEDLVPQRRAEILRFVAPYGDFLLKNQQASGVIPSWYLAGTLAPREEFRDFNAETAPSAVFLAELGSITGNERFTSGAERGMQFVQQQVLPRQRWFDFETYLSCARKDYGFFDSWTAQYPQNNLAEIQAPEAMLALYRATHKAEYLAAGQQMLDYLLLTQQVWSSPEFTPNLFGGFTTQNTDAEWSDARQGYAAVVLLDYYKATGSAEYLERSVAAARSTFAVAPWENWAHTGFIDEPGALTGFHWGTGSAMTTVELMQPELGDALIDVSGGFGVGFDEATVRNVRIEGERISFLLASPDVERTFHVRFKGVEPNKTYSVIWNHGPAMTVTGNELANSGITVGNALLDPSTL